MTENLRQRYADAIRACGPLSVTKVLYAVMAVRDDELESPRQRAETAEQDATRMRALFLERCGAIERVRHVCRHARAKKDAPGMWLVADQVLAALDDTKPETP